MNQLAERGSDLASLLIRIHPRASAANRLFLLDIHLGAD
jgi:hypothetical protein